MELFKSFRYLLLVGLTLSIGLSSCGDDEEPAIIRGCTDTAAANYNPDAEESDGSCEYSRDQFIGVYFGSILFETLSQLDQEDVEFTITPGIATENEVLVQITIQGAPLTLNGEASGNNILVDYANTLPDGGVFNPALSGQPVDLTFKGTVTTDDGGANIMGALDVVAVGDFMGTPVTIEDVGNLSGMKQ